MFSSWSTASRWASHRVDIDVHLSAIMVRLTLTGSTIVILPPAPQINFSIPGHAFPFVP